MSELKPGDEAPTFSLPSTDGGEIDLQAFIGKKYVVLFFYPKDSTPGCTREACGFRDVSEQLEDANAVVLGVSRDSMTSHQRFVEKQALNFPLLSDSDSEVCKAYGVYQLKKNYGREYWGIDRSTFLVDKAGKIVQIWRHVKVDGHIDKVLTALNNAQTA